MSTEAAALQALTDALTEGTDLDTGGAPDIHAAEIAAWLDTNGWAIVPTASNQGAHDA